MNIHEYQAKAILREFGVPVPDGHVCYNGASAREWAKRLGEGPWVVKAQIHAGGRGKGGGVKLARTPDEVRMIARDMRRHDPAHPPDRPGRQGGHPGAGGKRLQYSPRTIRKLLVDGQSPR